MIAEIENEIAQMTVDQAQKIKKGVEVGHLFIEELPPLDFGRIVFHLVDEKLLRKRDGDSLADFLDKFDFQEEFTLKVFEAEG